MIGAESAAAPAALSRPGLGNAGEDVVERHPPRVRGLVPTVRAGC